MKQSELDIQRDLKEKHTIKVAAITGSIALVLLLILVIGTFLESNSSYNSGHADSDIYHYYFGPVLPLAVSGDAAGLSAERQITYDLSRSQASVRGGKAAITDYYKLKNSGGQAKTIRLAYPLACTIDDLASANPVLLINGSPVEFEPLAGPAFKSADNDQLYLTVAKSMSEFSAIAAADYLAKTTAAFSEPDDVVTVYTISNLTLPAGIEDPVQVGIEFTFVDGKTIVFNQGFSGSSFDSDINRRLLVASPSELKDYCKLVVLGQPLSEYTLKGFTNGSLDTEIPGITGTVNVSTTSLAEYLLSLLEDFSEDTGSQKYSQLTYRALCQILTSDPLNNSLLARYADYGDVWSLLGDVQRANRVIYMMADVTIPADGSLDVSCSFQKNGSHDFRAIKAADVGNYGYELATRLGSALPFDQLKARVNLPDTLEITRQNMGFDIARGITEVTLDLAIDRYYIEVRVVE